MDLDFEVVCSGILGGELGSKVHKSQQEKI